MKLLIVEDEKRTLSYLKKGLTEEGFVVDTSGDGDEGLSLAVDRDYDLILLDINLPGRDGWSILAELRESGKKVPVLFLTAKDSVPDRVRGLSLGADDYLVKPFAFTELVARIRSVLRRGPARNPETLTIGDLSLDLARRRATRGTTTVNLRPKEFTLLWLLASREGQVVSKTVITEQVWEMNFEADSNVVEVAVRRLRTKIDDPFETKLIHTVRGMGYVLKAET